MLTLHVEPGTKPLSWDEFAADAPVRSIALDGYLNEGPRIDLEKSLANFDHHHNVAGFATLSTSGQVLRMIRDGLFKHFCDEAGQSDAHVFVNDCDEDVCLAWTMLNNPHMVEPTMNPLWNRLVAVEDELDRTGGTYPFPSSLPFLKELAWMFEPYRRFRLTGGLDRRQAEEYKSVITDVEHRILRHVTGNGDSADLDTRYETIQRVGEYALVHEIGTMARLKMREEGINLCVSARERPDGRFVYTLCKLSAFVDFDMGAFYAKMNGLEQTADPWGGSDRNGGSPRVAGSGITPEELWAHLNETFTMRTSEKDDD